VSLDARLVQDRRRNLRRQWLMSGLIVLHVVAGIAGETRGTTWGRAVYNITRPAQASLALWQNWAMFSPPPRTTSSLTAEGQRSDGSWVALPLPRGLGEPGTLTLRYDRFGKLERSAFKASRARLQRSIAHWVCRQAKATGTPMAQVRVVQIRAWTPKPANRGTATPRQDSDRLRTVVCR
jgi:hypothetical protein